MGCTVRADGLEEQLLVESSPQSRHLPWRLAAILVVVGTGAAVLAHRILPKRAVQLWGANGVKFDDIMRRPSRHADSNSSIELYGIVEDNIVDEHDVNQGRLGDCYFDAALVSIAHHHPRLIEEQFVDRSKWDKGVFTTVWQMVPLAPFKVAVNAMIPAKDNDAFFLWTKSDHHMWPVVMEKAWAKIFGTYKAIEGGWPSNVFKALLDVPVRNIYQPQENPLSDAYKQDLWNQLSDAATKKYPSGMGTSMGGFGMSGRHAYAVLDATPNYQGHGRAVRVYNPWGVNRYIGEIKGQGRQTGDFWVTLDEYAQVARITNVALVRPGYVVGNRQTMALSAGDGSAAFVLESTTDDDFYVQLEWPNDRFSKASGCQVRGVKATVMVHKVNGGTMFVSSLLDFHNEARVLVTGGIGQYNVVIAGNFPTWLTETQASTYAPKTVTQTVVGSVQSLFSDMTGMCARPRSGRTEYVLVDGDAINGFPYWRRADGRDYLGTIYWSPKFGKLKFGPSIAASKRGSYYRTDVASTVTCNGRLLQEQHGVETAELEEPMPLSEYKEAPTSLVGLDCMADINRLSELDNDDISASSDPLFPESMTSIALPGTDCGDAARGITESCAMYDHWQSFVDIADYGDKKAAQVEADKKCFSFNQPDAAQRQGKCIVKNMCAGQRVLSCSVPGCNIGGASLQSNSNGLYYNLNSPCCLCGPKVAPIISAAPTTTTTTTTTPACADNNGNCPHWAGSMKYCTDGPYVAWMKRECKLSCGLC